MTPLRWHLAHLRYVLLHKWLVYREGRQLGVPRRLLLRHDCSKFTRAEWPAYTRWFYGPQRKDSLDQVAYQFAWQHHWQVNPHHPEYWNHRQGVVPGDYATAIEPRAMPAVYVREMIADWHAAAQAKQRCGLPALSTRAFYRKHGARFRLHPETRAEVERLLGLTNDPQ